MSWTSERARLAATIRDHPNDHERIAAVRRDLRVARLADQVRKVVNGDPPPTAEQRDRLEAELRGGAA
jgi:hypothetical protein